MNLQPTAFCRECGAVRKWIRVQAPQNTPEAVVSNEFVLQPADVDSLDLERACVCGETATDHSQRVKCCRVQQNENTWERAIETVTAAIKRARKEGHNRVGIYLPEQVFYCGNDWAQALAFAAKIGTTSFYTDQCRYDAPRFLVAEWMMGHAAPLLSDLGRSHYILHLGSDHRQGQWGSHQLGTFEPAIAHSRKTKGTKVVLASSRRSEYADTVDGFLSIRPGTEPFLLLGMLHQSLKSGWVDQQYIDKYTTGAEELPELLDPWTLERCANICGVSPAQLSGVALKFSRAAMAVVHPNSGTFSNANATLGAWAWGALHSITANMLRPGGVYENIGAFDLVPFYASMRMNSAPKSANGAPLLLMQNMGAQLLADLRAEKLDALIVVGEEVLYPQASEILALASTEKCILTVISSTESRWTEKADIVLPKTSSWEQDDLHMVTNVCLPFKAVPRSEALLEPYAESKPLSEILRLLTANLGVAWRGSEWGAHLRSLASMVMRSDSEVWLRRAWGLVNEEDLPAESGLNYLGESDRAAWRPVGNSINLCPTELRSVFASARPPEMTAEYPMLLQTTQRLQLQEQPDWAAQIIALCHPESGVKEGVATLKTHYGQCEVLVEHSDRLHTDAVYIPFERFPGVLDVLSTETDSWSGTPKLDGECCALLQE